MTEKKLKGLFGGGEADDVPGATVETKAQKSGRGGRGGRGGGRRRRSAEAIAQQQDFINRYTTGNPAEGFSSEEAIGYLRQLQGEVPPEVMQRAAVETVRNLPEDQRKAFAEMLQRRQAGSGMVTIERTGEARATEGRGGPQAGGAGMDDLFGSLFGGMLGGGTAQPAPQPRGDSAGGFGMDDMLGGLLGGLLGGGAPQPSQGQGQAGDPFGGLLGGLLGGGMGTPAPQPTSRQEQAQDQGGGIGDILGSPLGKAVLGGIAAYAMKEMMEKDQRG